MPETASGDFLVNSSEVSGEIEYSSPERIGGKTPSEFDGHIGSSYCHNDPVGKVDVLGLKETWVTNAENPISRLADGSLVVNELTLVSPDFLIWRKPHIDGSRTRQRPMANGDYRMWQQDGSTGKWGPTNYNRSLLALGQGVANSGARELAVAGTVVINAATAAFAAPAVVSSGGAVLTEVGYAALAAGGTQLAQASVWVSATGATVSAGYQRMYPLLNRVARSPTLHSIASDGQHPALARPGPWRISFMPASYERAMPLARGSVADDVASAVANTTRTGARRTNPADWRATRDLWDEVGYGEVLSPANRAAIARARTPVVDDAWVRFHPEDAGLLGERIPMHHVQGLPITIPLPATRHLDAHMPGGFRYNPGGTGSQLPLYPATGN